MHMHSRHSVTRCGGIGVTVPTAGDGTTVGDGIVLTMLGDIIRAIGAAGMAATGVAGMAVAIGDIIIIGMVLAGAGVVVETIGHGIRIRIAVLMGKAVIEIPQLSVGMVRVLVVPVVLLSGLQEIRLVLPVQLMVEWEALQDV